MRYRGAASNAENAGEMDADEITFADLLADEPVCAAPPKTFGQLLADGFPHKGGLPELAAIGQMEDPGPQLAAVRHRYLELLAVQGRTA